MEASGGWQEQLVEVNKVLASLSSVKCSGLDRPSEGPHGVQVHAKTGVGVADPKKRRRLGRDGLGLLDLVPLLKAENAFVRHTVKKTLVALSEACISKSQTSSWASLVHHIWAIVEEHAKHVSAPPWPAVCGLETLRSILKSCITEDATVDEYVDVFLALLGEKIDGTVRVTCQLEEARCSERGLVWSALLQLLCTSVRCCDAGASPSASSQLVIAKVGACVPLLARVALARHAHASSVHCPSSFLRHKTLRLMIGLSRWFERNHRLALECLRALREEGGDLIGFSLVKDSRTLSNGANLMCSPFLASIVGSREEAPRSAAHLVCRALFLLFRIWSLVEPNQALGMSRLKGNHSEDRKELEDRAPADHHGFRRAHTSCQCGSFSEKALKIEADADVEGWLRLQGDGVKLKSFSTTLLGLFLDEDDLMIQMLLLLARLRSRLLEKGATGLRPLGLFQALLEAVSHDHTVLVDFLISESTGSLFLEYLMLVTKGEMEASGCEGVAKESLECLVELKTAVERLHRRKLFPYNPSSLLKRLGKLEELQQRV